MISITFPDKSIKDFKEGITGKEIASSISKSLAELAVAIEVNGLLIDIYSPIEVNSSIRILTVNDQEALEIIRHNAIYIIAKAVKDLFPDTRIANGSVIKDGFYYDFARSIPFSVSDLEKIESRMRKISEENQKFVMVKNEIDKSKAISTFEEIGEHYKSQIIRSSSEEKKITLLKQGNFIDLCWKKHLPTTGRLEFFKLLKIAGVYWQGNNKNEMLQRIYGTAWATKKQLESHLYLIKEVERRDHRKLGRELNLFHFQEEAQGMVFWHPKGYSVYRTIKSYIRKKLEKKSYMEVQTPIMFDKKIWEESGHWEKFHQNMFIVKEKGKVYALKPMNCPGHIQIFKQGIKSYRDLPLRIAEFGCCHRNEATGSLHGLFRVKSFVQDDAHIFCTEEQINNETVLFCELLKEIYNDFGFKQIKVKFSDRPQIRAGDDDIWHKAESALKRAVEHTDFKYEKNPGEGAFYGPKLEFVLTDAVGRDWQCGTLQVDFILPDRLKAEYVSATGEKKKVVMLHRAIIGTFERFIGILIEQYAGYFPLWLAPIQIAIIGVNNGLDNHVIALNQKFVKAGIRSDLDISKENLNYKIKRFFSQKVPLIGVVGEKEQSSGTVTVRRLRSLNEQKTFSVDEIIKTIIDENNKYLG